MGLIEPQHKSCAQKTRDLNGVIYGLDRLVCLGYNSWSSYGMSRGLAFKEGGGSTYDSVALWISLEMEELYWAC